MPDSPTFRSTSLSSFASTASNMSHLSSNASSFPADDDLLADKLFGAPDDGHNDTSMDDDDSVLVNFPSVASSTGTTLSHSGSLSSFPDLSGDPSSVQKDQQQQRSSEDNKQLLSLHSSTHLSLCIKHLLVAHRLSTSWQPTIVSLTQQAVGNVRPDMRKGDMMDIRYYVHIQPIPGGRKEDSAYVDGLAFQHTLPTPSTMVRYSLDSPRVLLFAGAIESPNKLNETRFLSSLLSESVQRGARPDIVFVERYVSRYVGDALRGSGVSLVMGVELAVLERIARCTRATIVNAVDDVDGRCLGMCGHVRVEEYGISIDEDERQDGDTDILNSQQQQPQQQQQPKKQEIEIELSDLFGGTTIKQPTTTSSNPSNNSFDPFGGLLGNSPPPPSTALTSTSPGNVSSILGSSFYNVGSGVTSSALQEGAGSFKDLFSGLSVRDSTPPTSSSPFSPTAASTSRRVEPTYVPFFFLRGCQPFAHGTLVLRGSRSLTTLHKLQRVLQVAVHIAYNLSLEQALLFEAGVTYTAQSLASMEQKEMQNIEQARVAMQAVEEGGGPPQYMTLMSSSPHITLPPIPFYPSLLNYRAQFPLPISPHLQMAQSANNTANSFKPNNSPIPPSQPPPLQHAASWSQPVTRDLLNFSAPTLHNTPATPPFDPASLNFSSLAPPTCTALMQSNLLVGSCWYVPLAGQCRAPDLKTIDFYSASDKTLADFLFSNCFDVQARCVNPTCKKDIFRHTLAYTHNDGRLLITVKQRRPEGAAAGADEGLGLPAPGPPSRSTSSPLTVAVPGDVPRAMSPQPPTSGQSSPPPSLQYSPTSSHRGLPLPAPPVLQANKQSQPPLPRGASTVTHASTPTHPFSFNSQMNQPSPSSSTQHPNNSFSSPPTHPSGNPASAPPPAFSSNTLITWSRCKICNHRVTPYMPLSAASLSYSFGKYLDLTFNNHSAMSTCASCPHPVHTAHVRYIAIGDVVACFEYEKAQPFAVVARPRVKYDRSEVMEGRLVHLSTLAMVSKQVFDEFLTKIGEIEANSRSASFKDLLQQLYAKVKHEEDTFTLFYKRHGLKVSMLDNLAALNMSAEKNNAALVQSLVEGDVDDEANALFGDEKSPTGEERREQRPLLDTFDIHRLHRKLVLSFIEWNKMLTEMCSFIFPKGWEDSFDSMASLGGTGGAAVGTGTGAGTGEEERKERNADVLQINIERSAHRLPPAPIPFNRDSAISPSPSPYVKQPGSPSLSYSSSKEPLTPTLFSSLHSPAPSASPSLIAQSLAGATQTAVSPNAARNRATDGSQSATLLDTAQLKSMLSNMSDMFGGSKKGAIRRSFKPNVTVDDIGEHNPKLRDVVTELIASPLSHGHFSLPHCVGGIAVPVYDDEPSSIIAYTLASFEHLQLVNPSKVEEMKQLEKDRAAAEAEKQQQQLNGAAPHGTNGRAAPPRPANGEINFFDDAVHVDKGDGGLMLIDNYVNPTPATGTADLFDLSSFGASPPLTAAAPVQLSAAPTQLYKPSPFSFASPAPTASPLASAVQQSSQPSSAPIDNHRAKLLGAVGPRSSISAQLYVHPHSQWFASDRSERAVEECMVSGFADRDKDEFTLKLKFEDLPHHTQQPGDQLTQFKCIAYYPRQFHALRSHTCNGDYDFIQSMSRSDKWATTGGKSGSTFSKTSDDRYVLKYVKKQEFDMFLEMAQHYFGYMAKVCFRHTPSVLVKILGVYTLSWQKGKKEGMSALHVIVMPNLFYQKTNVKIFDLKGSERNRYIKTQTPATVAPTPQLPPLPPSSSTSALSVLSSTLTSASPPPPLAAPAESSATLLDLNLWEYTRGLPIPVHESSHSLLKVCLFNDSQILSGLSVIDYSLLVGFDHTNGELLVGVIDYIRKYTWDKKMETGIKSMGKMVGQAVPTIIDPTSYKQRFRAAMEKYFMIAPDQCSWFRKVQEKEDDNVISYVLKEEQEEKENSRRARGGNSNSNISNNDKPVDRPGSASQSEKPSGSKMGMFKWGKE